MGTSGAELFRKLGVKDGDLRGEATPDPYRGLEKVGRSRAIVDIVDVNRPSR